MFKKFTYALLAALFAAALTLTLSSCADTATLENVYFSGDIKAEYVRNEEIDLTGISVNLVYSDGETKTFPLPYDGVEVSGGDTSDAGEDFTLTLSYKGGEKTFTYSVRNPVLKLNFGDGTWEENKTHEVSAEENYTDLAPFTPTPDKEYYEFAGWFFDEALTLPVRFNFDGQKIDTSSDVTVYAGYDWDYSERFEFVENSDYTITLTKLKPSEYLGFGSLGIPTTVRLLPVVKIADNFIGDDFAASMLMYDSLEFAEDSKVEEIGEKAFYGVMSFQTLVLPKTLVRIGAEAFTGTGVTELTVPASVESIDAEAFSTCAYLADVEFEEGSALTFIGEDAFSYCTALSMVALPEKLTTLSSYVFRSCENLEEVSLDKNVKQVGLHAFLGCSRLVSINVSAENQNYKTINNDLYSRDGTTFIRYCFGKPDAESILPDGVTSVYESAFDATNVNQSLKKLSFPDSLTHIYDYAFRDLDADFTLPKSLSYISEKAFADYGGSVIQISSENPNFAVKDGVLYSKDFKTLISVPARLETKEFVLDERVETIASGAFSSNETIKYFVIPENSALSLLKKGSFVFFKAKNLGGVYIYKEVPFALEEEAFNETDTYPNASVALYVLDSYKDSYATAWKNVTFKDGSKIDEYIVGTTSVASNVVSYLKELVSVDENATAEQFATATDNYIDDILAWSYNPDFVFLDRFTSVYNSLDGAYYASSSLVAFASQDEKQILTLFETKTINALTEFYLSADDRTFVVQPSFYRAYEHYLSTPDFVKEALTETSANFASILKKTDDIKKIQQNIIDTAAKLVADVNNTFNVEEAKKIYADYEKYNTKYADSRWSDFINIEAVHCSLLINEFLSLDKTPDNYVELNRLADGYFDENTLTEVFGINTYLNSYFKAKLLRSKLYRYDEFEASYEKWLSGGAAEVVNEINEAVANYDLTAFDLEEALRVCNLYASLSDFEKDWECYEKYLVICFRIDFTNFANLKITSENYSVACEIYLGAIANYRSYIEVAGVTQAEIKAFDANVDALLALFATRNSDFVAEVEKVSADPSAVDLAKFDNLYALALDDGGIAGLYHVTLTDADGKYETNVSELFSVLMVLTLQKQIATEFDEVTADNYKAISNIVYGYEYLDPDTFIYYTVFGINYYSYWVTIRAYNVYLSNFLTEEEAAKYNALTEQFNNFEIDYE